MATIHPVEVISTMSGKVCMHSKMYFRTNRQTGKVTTGKVCYHSTKPASEKQLAQNQAFGTLSTQAHAWIATNNPKEGEPTAEGKKMYAAYLAQHTVGSYLGFIAKRIKAGMITV